MTIYLISRNNLNRLKLKFYINRHGNIILHAFSKYVDIVFSIQYVCLACIIIFDCHLIVTFFIMMYIFYVCFSVCNALNISSCIMYVNETKNKSINRNKPLKIWYI